MIFSNCSFVLQSKGAKKDTPHTSTLVSYGQRSLSMYQGLSSWRKDKIKYSKTQNKVTI